MKKTAWRLLAALAVMSTIVFAASACRSETASEHEHEDEPSQAEALALPELQAADLNGAPLTVVATTSIIGDVVAQVGGEAIELTTLMGPGQDPHSYEPTPQDMATASQAHVVFVNGWDLEEALAHDLEDVAEDVPIVPVSANIEPLVFGGHENEEKHETGENKHDGDDHDHHEGADPHTWFSIHSVEQWVENIEHVLSDLDPAHAETYESNAGAYLAELEELEAYVETRLGRIPAENRVLVTNHDSLGYMARDYDLRILGTVLPAASTLADPSASDLAGLIQEMEEAGICTIFTEATVSDKLAQTVAAELEACDEVRVLKLYTGAVGPAGSGAESYIGMYRYNVDTIVQGLN
jgi:ABC-type Zn uptake system ZnuABC Zn-binding protein ZnuA